MVVWNLPAEWTPWIALLARHLPARLAWRLAPLLLGGLFARGRRTVASWLRAAGIRRGFPGYYYFLSSLGRRTEAIAGSLLRLALERLGVGKRLLFALADTPPRRVTDAKSKARASTTTLRQDRPTRSSSTVLFG